MTQHALVDCTVACPHLERTPVAEVFRFQRRKAWGFNSLLAHSIEDVRLVKDGPVLRDLQAENSLLKKCAALFAKEVK